MDRPIARILDLVDPASQRLWNVGLDEARGLLLAGDPAAVLGIAGSFALVAREGERVLLARSLDRPLRYFLAKDASGPALVVAERIDEIAARARRGGWSGQFHPTYTRMVPAHHVVDPEAHRLPGSQPRPSALLRPAARRAAARPRSHRRALRRRALRGRCALARAAGCPASRSASPSRAASTAARCCSCLYRASSTQGQSPARLKAFTLAVGGDGRGRPSGAGVPEPDEPRALSERRSRRRRKT